MNIDALTIRQVKQLQRLVGGQSCEGINKFIGQKVIVRTYSAGVWFGVLAEKSGNEIILNSARRMWRWFAKKGISLSECSVHGIEHSKSAICEQIETIWLEAIEIIQCTSEAIKSLEAAPHAQP